MSIEDDHDHLANTMKTALIEASRATQSAFPDVLVFMLRWSEVRDRLLGLADEAEEEAKAMSLPGAPDALSDALRGNVRPMRRPVPVPTPAYMSPAPYEPDRAYLEAITKERADALWDNVRVLRFLAAHVEEDRCSRLSIQDLAFLCLVPSHVYRPMLGPMPIGVPSPVGH
jgi:hypothetical protein